MKNALVSVIIPVYNGEKYIARCINSILNQSYKDLEIIIVDDNSKDKSAEIICEHMKRSNNIKYIKNEHTIGPAETRNKGLIYSINRIPIATSNRSGRPNTIT